MSKLVGFSISQHSAGISWPVRAAVAERAEAVERVAAAGPDARPGGPAVAEGLAEGVAARPLVVAEARASPPAAPAVAAAEPGAFPALAERVLGPQ